MRHEIRPTPYDYGRHIEAPQGRDDGTSIIRSDATVPWKLGDSVAVNATVGDHFHTRTVITTIGRSIFDSDSPGSHLEALGHGTLGEFNIISRLL